MDGNSGDKSSSTAALDVGAVPGADVFSPIQGKVLTVRTMEILGKYRDVEIDIQAADDPSLLITVSHIMAPEVEPGDTLQQGDTLLGRVRAFPSEIEQDLSRYTSDAGDHVQLVAIRVTPEIAGF